MTEHIPNLPENLNFNFMLLYHITMWKCLICNMLLCLSLIRQSNESHMEETEHETTRKNYRKRMILDAMLSGI